MDKGPFGLSKQEKSALLMDPRLLHELHKKVWQLNPEKGRDWGVDGKWLHSGKMGTS